MAPAKAISLRVRPTQSADLCYPVSGIIEYQPENLLGQAANAFNLGALQDKLEPLSALPPPSDLSNIVSGGASISALGTIAIKRVGDGPLEIEGALENAALSRLRAKDIATNLTQALSWHGLKNSADLTNEAINKRIELLGKSPSDPNSLLALLDSLSGVFKTRYDKLASLYQTNGPQAITNPSATSDSSTETTGGQAFTTTSHTETTYLGHEYQVPPVDNKARYLRSEIALRQERLAAFRLVQMNSRDNVLFAKAMTAAEVRKIQLDYIDTFLVAPFDGVVTAVFRNVGEFVSAGQPVLRLENDKTVYLVGQIKCRSLIRVGYSAHVTTTLFGEPAGASVEIDGTVCAVRGHEPIDEQWNVMIRCNNESPGGRILPLNYNFDFDSTEISIEA